MRARWVPLLLGCLVGVLGGQEGNLAEITLELPQFSAEERRAMDEGRYIPGSSLLGRIAMRHLFSKEDEVIEIDPAVLDLPEDEVVEESLSPRVIPGSFLAAYFAERPESFLNDPQSLLTGHEFFDQEKFLDFHARDTETNFYLYLFDEKQELPDGEGPSAIVNRVFGQRESLVVAFYYLGAPKRAQVIFSEAVKATVPGEERYKVLEMAIEAAEEKVEVVAQLENFSTQLSKRLYWMEKVVARYAGDPEAVFAIDEDYRETKEDFFVGLRKDPLRLSAVLGGAILVPGFLAFSIWRYFRERSRAYVFPDAEGSQLFEAPHAAGVGGVVSFASVSVPPSRQLDELPDYLQKM